MKTNRPDGWHSRLPFCYGWLIIAIAFVTMAVGVSARTAFSLFLPPLIDEFGWDRGLAAGAFSFGFLASAVISPTVGRIVDKHGPRMVIESGIALLSLGLFLAPLVETPWHLYATLGVLVGAGANLMSFTAHSRTSSTPPGPQPNGPSRAQCAPPASGGSSWATSAPSLPGTRCRCTRRSTSSRSDSARSSQPGRWGS